MDKLSAQEVAELKRLLVDWLAVKDDDDKADLANRLAADLFAYLESNAPALIAAAEAQQWRPIETAPKDGSRVILHNAFWSGPSTGLYYSATNCWSVGYEIKPFLYQPTHWMPLPPPPGDTA